MRPVAISSGQASQACKSTAPSSPATSLSGFLASVAGLFLALRIDSGAPTVGDPFLLDSITAVLLGGTTFVGGRGGLVGTVGGTLVLTVLANFLVTANVHTYWQYIVRAGVLFIAVVAYTMKRRAYR